MLKKSKQYEEVRKLIKFIVEFVEYMCFSNLQDTRLKLLYNSTELGMLKEQYYIYAAILGTINFISLSVHFKLLSIFPDP